MRAMTRILAIPLLALLVGGCAAASTQAPTAAPASAVVASPATSAVPSAAASMAPPVSAAASPSAATISSVCLKGSVQTLTSGMLTIGTDNPAYPPWFGGNPANGSTWQVSDPTSGQGLESATAYAIADKLGFAKADVTWVVVAFNNAIQPGTKKFDFDINQVSYTADRAKAVDLSDGYFDNNQAVVGFKGSPITAATSMADLKSYRLGTQVGTTAYQYIVDNIKPAKVSVYNDTTGAIAALKAKQIDGIVVDLGTAFYITAAQMDNGVIVGSLPTIGAQEHFSAVLNKGSALTTCVNQAIATLKADGTLDQIRKQWIEAQGAPALQP